MALPTYASTGEKIWHYTYLTICGLVFFFLIAPILIIIPLSFNAEPYFTFTEKMLSLDPEGYSTRWYWDILKNGMANPDAEGAEFWADMWANAQWVRAVKNSFIVGIPATLTATALGTLASIGLSRSEMPYKKLVMSILISPMIIPLVIMGASMFYFFSNDFNVVNWFIEGDQPPEDRWQLTYTYGGLILAHEPFATELKKPEGEQAEKTPEEPGTPAASTPAA